MICTLLHHDDIIKEGREGTIRSEPHAAQAAPGEVKKKRHVDWTPRRGMSENTA